VASLADKAAALGATFSSALGSVGYFFNSFGQDLGSFLSNFSLGTFGAGGQLGGSGPFGSGAGVNPFFQLNMRDFSAGKNVIPNAEDFKNELGKTLDIAPEDLKDISTETLLGLLQQVLPEEFATLMGGLTGATEADIQKWVNKSTENLIVDMLGLDGVPTYGDPNFIDYITEYYSFRNGTETERSVEYKDRRLTETVEQAFKDLGYNPSPEEIDELKKNPSGVAEYVDPRYVTEAEAEAAFEAENGYKPNAKEIQDNIGQRNQQTTKDEIKDYVDPRQITEEELVELAAQENYPLTEEEIKKYTGQGDETFQDSRIGPEGSTTTVFDEGAVTDLEAVEKLEEIGVDVAGEAERLGQTPEEYAGRVRASMPAGAGSEAEFQSFLMAATTTAASTGPNSFVEAVKKMGTGVKNLLFGTNSGSPKPWAQILREQIEKKFFPLKYGLPNFPLAVTFDQDGASAANPTGALVRVDLKIPVPLPVSGPPISIPIFDANGNYVNRTFKELFLEPDTGIIRQIEAGVVDTAKEIGRIFEGAQGAVIQVFDEVGNVFRAIPLAEYEAWKEGGKNPFDIETNENGEVIPQTDENGNPATSYDPDTGLPVYEQLDEEEAPTPPAKAPRGRLIVDKDGNPLNIIGTDGTKYVLDGEGQWVPAAVGGGNGGETVLPGTITLVLDTLEDTLDGLGLDIDDIETILGRIQTDLQNVTTAEDLETFRTNLIAELTDPDTGLPSMGIDADELGDALEPITKAVRDLGTAINDVGRNVGLRAVEDDPNTPDVDESRPATGLYGYIDDAVEAVEGDVEAIVGVADVDGEGNLTKDSTGLYLEFYNAGIDYNTALDLIGNEDEGTGLYGYIDKAVEKLATKEDVKNLVGVPEYGVDANGEPTTEIVGGTGLYGVMFGIDAGNDAALEAFIGTAPTKDNAGNIVEGTGSGLLLTLAQQGTAIEDLPAAVEQIVGVPEYGVDADGNSTDEVIGGTGLYGDMYNLGIDVGRIEGAIGNKDAGTGLYGYISGIRDDIVQNYIGEPEYGVDADGNTTDEIVGGTGLYGVMFGIDAGNDAALEAFIGTAPTKDNAGNIVEGTGSGLLLTLAQQGTAIEDLPAAVEQIVGVPEYGVDADGNSTDEVIGGTGLYGDMYNLGIDVGRIEGAIGNKDAGTGLYGYISGIRDDIVQNYIGEPEYGVDADGNTTDEIVGGTGLYGVMFGIDAGNDAALEAFIGTAPTKDDAGNIVEGTGSGLLLTLAQQDVQL
jgi:hypothetical protein